MKKQLSDKRLARKNLFKNLNMERKEIAKKMRDNASAVRTMGWRYYMSFHLYYAELDKVYEDYNKDRRTWEQKVQVMPEMLDKGIASSLRELEMFKAEHGVVDNHSEE